MSSAERHPPEIRELVTEQDWLAAFPVLKELRPALTPETLIHAWPVQRDEGYRLFGVVVAGQILSCLGWRIQTFLHSGKTLYVDDLITAASARGNGYARALLDHAQAQALANGCRTFSLDSGHHRYEAHRVYLNFGLQIRSHHFAKEL